jgi:membrane protease YdiL (CAAX protease family)
MTSSPQAPEPYPWKLFWLLLTVEIVSILATLPIALDLLSPVLTKFERPNFPLPLLILAGVIQNLTLLAFTLWLGLKLSRRIGLGVPLLEAWITRRPEPRKRIARTLYSGLCTGLALGIVWCVSLLALVPRLPNLPFVFVAQLPVWKRFLLCFYGGVYEELLTRLFLLTLFAWILDRSWRNTVPKLSNPAFWFANILVAILFGLGHLPSASLFMPITPLVVVAALLLNGIAGIAFGYLYRKDGLEAAMIAHFTTDFMIYVVGSVFLN